MIDRPVVSVGVKSDSALTHRERECLEGLALGLTNAGIAKRLGLALPTVAMHLTNARKRLGARTREQAVAQAVSLGLIDLPRGEAPTTISIFLSGSQRPCQPEGAGRIEPRLIDVEQRIIDGKLEFEVREVGFRFVVSDAANLKAVVIRWRGTDVSVQSFYRDGSPKTETLSQRSDGTNTCECWGAGVTCFPIE
jgi:DNA-binding CsgD family transcriptional regulator